MAPAFLALIGKVSMRMEFDSDGTTFWPDQVVNTVHTVGVIGFIVAAMVYAICAPLKMMDIPLPTGQESYYPFISGMAIVVALPYLWQVLSRGGVNYLTLTAEGFELGGSYFTTHRGWWEVSDVTDSPPQGGQPFKSGTTFIATTDGRTKSLNSDWYTPAGRALHRLLRFYWQHSEKRNELTDGRAIERLIRYQDGAEC